MGTSSSFGGPLNSTPLVPTWLMPEIPIIPLPEDLIPEIPIIPSVDAPSENPSEVPRPQVVPEVNPLVPVPAERQPLPSIPTPTGQPVPNRFRQARSDFSKYVRSNSNERRALGRSVSSYVSKASGGSRNAAQRMGSSRRATVGLINFLNSVRTSGLQETLTAYNLGNLVGQSIEDIFVGIVDFICPEGGSVDEGIARDAFIETIADLAEQGITDLNALTVEQIRLIVELYATHAIEARLCNDIGTKIFVLPENLDSVEQVQEQLHDFIQRGVSDVLESLNDKFTTLTAVETNQFVDQIYVEAFGILETLGEQESDNE